jgi:Protein of unknown function (DUF2569)
VNENPEPLLTAREREFLSNNSEGSLVQAMSVPEASPALVGVAGWLAFLAFSLTFLGPLVTLGRTAADISTAERTNPGLAGSSDWSSLVAMAWLFSIIYCAITIFAGYRLYKHHVPNTVPIVLACLWTAGPALALIGLLAFGSDEAAIADLVRTIFTTGIWTAYLLLSKRVKNTYSDPQPNSQLVATFE